MAHIDIDQIEVIPYALPFKEPYVTARGTLPQREMVLLRIRDSDGVVGVGDAVPLSLRGDVTLADVARGLEALKWIERAKPDDEAVTYSYGGETLADAAAPACAESAWESAYWDLVARRAGQPAWKYSGAGSSEPIRCNATLAAGGPSEVARRAREWAEDGFTSFKLKVGVENDLQQVKEVRRVLGPEMKLRADANGHWSAEEAVTWLRALESEDLELIEQPCATLEELAEVRRRTTVPVAADESITWPPDLSRARALGACDLVTVKLAKDPFPRPYASEFPIYMSSALDGPAGIAQAGHLWQSIRGGPGDAGLAHGLATQRLFASTIASKECELRNGYLHLPDGPGLGVEIDDAALERHRL